MVAATRHGLGTGIAASLASSLAYNFFFIPPTYTLTIQDPQNIITVLVLLGVAAVSSQLAARVREQALLAQGSATLNGALAGFARLLTSVSQRDELAQLLCAEIGRLLDAKATLLMPGPEGLELRAASPPGERLEMLDMAAARWASDHGRAAGRGSDTLTASEWLFQPIAAGGRTLAVFGLARSDARSPVRSDQLPLLLSLLDQAGLALERIAIEGEMAELSQIRERDRLRHALLSSVSHDLRTPLTAVLSGLHDIRAASPELAEQLAPVCADAEQLNRFVGNLLDMVRTEGSMPDPELRLNASD
jgi:two-component system sensor histidine kinase KdpD